MSFIGDGFVLGEVPQLLIVQTPLPAGLDELVPIIVIPSLCLMIAWLVWVLNRTTYLKTKAQIELHNQLVQRIHSTQDVLRLLETEAGRQLLDALSLERPTTREEIVNSVRKGIILSMVGLGGLLLRLIFPMGYGVFILASVLVGMIGAGLLVSSFVVYRLSQSWGLISDTRPKNRELSPHDTSLFR